MSRRPLSDVPFEELIQRARAGDAAAREELFQRCQPTLTKWGARFTARLPPGGARPSDFAQDTALMASKKLASFQGNTAGEWFSWLKTIFRSQALQARRASNRQKREPTGVLSLDSGAALQVVSPQESPSQLVTLRDEAARLLAYVFQLPADQHQAIKLCYLEELPVAQAAQRLGRTEPSVGGLLRRGLKTIERQMKRSADPEPGDTSALLAHSTVEDALLRYLRRRQEGETISPAAFAAEHSSCGDELLELLHWIERLQALRPTSASK